MFAGRAVGRRQRGIEQFARFDPAAAQGPGCIVQVEDCALTGLLARSVLQAGDVGFEGPEWLVRLKLVEGTANAVLGGILVLGRKKAQRALNQSAVD